MFNNSWSRLNHLQLGKYGEQFAKMAFLSHGCDIYSSEVNDHGIDFVMKSKAGAYYDIQVKSCQSTTNYMFAQKDKFNIEQENLYLVLIIFKDDHLPKIFLIPACAWKKENDLLRNRPYGNEGQTSKPEWGINISNKNMHLLGEYLFEKIIDTLI
jgi:hypothetical protein